MNLVNKPPYMGLNCINRLLFATTLLCELASQKISLKCNTLNLFKAFGTLKKTTCLDTRQPGTVFKKPGSQKF